MIVVRRIIIGAMILLLILMVAWLIMTYFGSSKQLYDGVLVDNDIMKFYTYKV